ncbi:MAG: VWA domain-containing protein [Flavobacteriales bacterium]
MRSFLILFVFIFAEHSRAQIIFDKVKYDFGDLEAYDDRFVDIRVTNKGSKREYLLSVKKPLDVVYLVNGQFIEKDSSLIVRLQVNPKLKGRFNYEVDIYTSDKDIPMKIKLTGSMKNLPSDNMSAFTSCPDFSSRPGGRANNFDLTVVTIDKETKKPLSNSKVTLIQNGQPVWARATDKQGKIKEESTVGFSYFYATHDLYFPAELGAYINFQRNYIVLELQMDPAMCLPVPQEYMPVPVDTMQKQESVIAINDKLEDDLKNEQAEPILDEVPVAFTSLDKEDFSDENFKPVNVVFVLDISASMNQGDKMELMKYSLFQLVGMLRPQDKMAIVTYATDAQILLKPTSGSEKERINAEVTALKAGGMTAGGEGIKLGYKQALKGKLPDGANQIIVITDGAFNRNSTDYKKFVKKYRKKGISMSVVGVMNKEVDEKEMREAAEVGGGRYVPVHKLVDAQNNLKQEIRMSSFRRMN